MGVMFVAHAAAAGGWAYRALNWCCHVSFGVFFGDALLTNICSSVFVSGPHVWLV